MALDLKPSRSLLQEIGLVEGEAGASVGKGPDADVEASADVLMDQENEAGEASGASDSGEGKTDEREKQAGERSRREGVLSEIHSAMLSRPMRVLVVDDSEALRRLIDKFLSAAGAETTIASDGREAVEMAVDASRRGRSFDVILMDMQMPHLNGRDAVIALRATGYEGTVVALTANYESFDAESCIAAGCNEYATKPIQPNVLIELIQRVRGEW